MCKLQTPFEDSFCELTFGSLHVAFSSFMLQATLIAFLLQLLLVEECSASFLESPVSHIRFEVDATDTSRRRFTPLDGITDAMVIVHSHCIFCFVFMCFLQRISFCRTEVANCPLTLLPAFAQFVKCKNQMYFFGGYDYDGSVMSKSVQVFDIANETRAWSIVATLPPGVAESHQGLACDAKHNRIFVIAGQLGPSCSPPVANAWLFDLTTMAFRRIVDLPLARHGPSAVVIAGHLHVFGGSDESRWRAAEEHWFIRLDDAGDPVGDWTVASFGVPESGAHAVVVNVDDSFILYLGAVSDICAQPSHVSLRDCNLLCDQSLDHKYTSIPIRFAYRCDVRVAVEVGGNCWESFDVPDTLISAPNVLEIHGANNRTTVLFVGGREPTPFEEAARAPIRVVPHVNLLDVHTLRWTTYPPLPLGVKSGVLVQHNNDVVVLDLTSSSRQDNLPRPPKTILRASLTRWLDFGQHLSQCLGSLRLRRLAIETVFSTPVSMGECGVPGDVCIAFTGIDNT
jgi:hypothetical protein